MKTLDAINFFRAIDKYNQIGTPMPSKLNYAININKKRLSPLMEAYDEAMKEIVEKYAQRDEENNMVPAPDGGILIAKEHREAYLKEVNVLQSEPIKMDIHFVDFNVLPENFPPAIQSGIDPMLREPENVHHLHPVPKDGAA